MTLSKKNSQISSVSRQLRKIKYQLYYKLLDYFLFNHSQTQKIRALICFIALDYNINPILALRIAWCESKLNPNAININQDGSEDVGLFQWNLKYHPEITKEIALDPIEATMLFCEAVNEGNLYWWNSSKNCWDIGDISKFVF